MVKEETAWPGEEFAVSDEGLSAAETISLAWDAQIRVLSNASVWGGVLAAFGIGSCLATVLFLAISQNVWALAVGAGLFAFFMLLFLLIGIVIDLCGGFKVTFALTNLGVRSIAGRGAGRAADAAFWTGVLTGRAGAAGAGLLAKSEQNAFIPYGQVTKVQARPGGRTILVKGGFLDKPIRLYCTAENYAQAEALLRQKCPTLFV